MITLLSPLSRTADPGLERSPPYSPGISPTCPLPPAGSRVKRGATRRIVVGPGPGHREGNGQAGIFVDDGIATGAVLFCFYDGTEASPAIASEDQARAFARNNGFSEEADFGTAD